MKQPISQSHWYGLYLLKIHLFPFWEGWLLSGVMIQVSLKVCMVQCQNHTQELDPSYELVVHCLKIHLGLSEGTKIQNSLARIVYRTTCLSHTTPLRKALHWLPIRHRCIFKTALLVYKYLHTNCPKYFSPFLKVRQCAKNTRLSQSHGIILHVPQYQPSIYKSTKQFGLSFAYDAPKIWNELPDIANLTRGSLAKKKIMFLHSKNKASRKGYKGEC